MLVDMYLYEEYSEMKESIGKKGMAAINKEARALMVWGERHGPMVVNPERSLVSVKRVCDVGGERQEEILTEEMGWPIERDGGNAELVKELDVSIVSAFRAVKAAGFRRPSCSLYHAYLSMIHDAEWDARWEKSDGIKAWCGVNLVLQRLHSTARLAARYENVDKFGPMKVYKDGKVISYRYDRVVWRKELARRGLLPG